MRTFLTVASLLVLNAYFTAIARAAEAGITGVGVTSCADFGKMYKTNPAETELVYFTWAQGFMSGYNGVFLASDQSGRNLAAESFDDQKVHIRDYCDRHPLATYMSAVFQLYASLPPSSPLISAPRSR